MSYLNTPRLTFSGQFQADPSTVNNDPTHYDNSNFQESFQDYSSATDLNGWWNPDGTGNWRFIGCTVKSVTYQDGTSTDDPLADPVIGMSIMDTDTRTAGKIVDLDSQQQMVSELWGFIVRIVSGDGNTLMRGDYEVAPFTNIWFNRSVDLSRDSAAAAIYQSVISNITWDKGYTNSRYLNELRKVSAKALSINFTVDRYNGDNNSAQFTLGRIAGSIGPTSDAEPKRFVLGRQLFAQPLPPPPSAVNFATAIVDEKLGQLVLDMGNSLQFSTGGVVNESRDLRIGFNTGPANSPTFNEVGKIDYSDPDWYLGTSGILTYKLTKEQVTLIQKSPLVIMGAVTTTNDVFSSQSQTTFSPVMAESVQYVRADQFVFRMDPGDQCKVQFFVTNYGKPIANQVICIQDSTAALFGPSTVAPTAPPQPPVGYPGLASVNSDAAVAAGASPVTITTDKNGKAIFNFTAPDPGKPRVYIDGQVYALSYYLQGQNFLTDCNPANFLSIQIYSGAPDPVPAADWNYIQPIMQQYANLYPLMSKGVFNLANKDVVDKNAQILKLVFSKEKHDPNYMPATRDLSGFNSRMILEYLQNAIDNTEGEQLKVQYLKPKP